MVSRVYLELNFSEERKINFLRPQNQKLSKPDSKQDSKPLKNLSVTPKDSEVPNLPKPSQKYFEVRRISYQTIRTKTRTELPSTIPRPLSIKSERNCSISPKKLHIKRFNSSKTSDFEDIEAIPSTPSRTYYNERLIWKKRKEKSLPLCIINFNGVIGDHSRLFEYGENEKFRMVEGSRSGLRLLSSDFFVVVVSWSNREATRSLIRVFDEQDVEFDALYIVRHRRLKHRFRHNYAQIFSDFSVEDMRSALLVTSLTLSREEIIERQGGELFYEDCLSGSNRITTVGFPPFCKDFQGFPLCVLVPHCSVSEERINFMEFARFLSAVKAKCEGNLTQADFDGEVALPCEHDDLPLIPGKPMTGSGIRYLIYTFCKSRKKRPPIMRKSSKFK
jgi:hypothetical protein